MTLQFTSAQTKNIPNILTLQQESLVQNRSLENIQKEGFVTVVHSLNNLKKIFGPYTHSIALDENDKVVGFALVMLKEYRNEIEILKTLYRKLAILLWVRFVSPKQHANKVCFQNYTHTLLKELKQISS